MMFSVETERSDVVRDFVMRASGRLGLGFHGLVRVREHKSRLWVTVILEPGFPPVWRYMSLGILCGLFVFRGWTPWMFISLVPMVVEIFLTPRFQRLLLTRGLRKAGYAGYVRRVTIEELVRGLLE